MRRRDFIKTSTAGSTLAIGFPLIKFNQPKFRLAVIGCGWWGNNILHEAILSERVEVVGLCDVDEQALKDTLQKVSDANAGQPKTYIDYRECIEDSDPELVIIGTPDHWHALGAIAAINAGAHVYLEKPISHTIDEGKAILKAARSKERVVQVGTHRRVSPHNITGMDFLRSGMVGEISAVKCFVNYGQGHGEITEDSTPPAGLDWDMWLGPAPYRDYNARIHPKGFRNFLDYANGTIGDWGIHWFDQVLWWTEERYPKNIFSSGGRFIKQDNTDAPDTQLAIFQFENFTLHWENKACTPNANESANVGCYFYGTKGTFHMGWLDGWTFYPKGGGKPIHQEASLHAPDQQNIKELWRDMIEAIDKKRLPVCDIEHGYLATNISLLAMISLQTGRSIEWDGKTILNDPEAEALMRRAYREPWEYPT